MHITPQVLQHTLFIFLIFIFCISCGKQPQKKFKILVVHSYEPSYAPYTEFNNKISKQFEEEGIQAEIHTFYLNCDQFNAASEEYYMYHSLDTLTLWKPDLILVNEDQATFTLMHCAHPFVQTVPIVFAGVNFPNRKLLSKYPKATGFWDKPDYLTNVQLMERILGKITIFMLHDSTFIDMSTRKEVHQQMEKGEYTVTENAPNYPVITPGINYQTESRFMYRPPATTVNIIPVQGDRIALVSWYLSNSSPFQYYLQAKKDFRVVNTSKYSTKPSFTVINEEFGYSAGLVGGYITSMDTQVKESVHRAAQLLQGTSPSNFPLLTESHKEYIFNYKEIEDWGLDKALFPQDAVYLNRPFAKKHPFINIGLTVLGSILTLSFILSILYMYMREKQQRHNIQQALLREKESLALALDKAKESDKMKSVFLANMSHEIRTPLNAIIGFSSLLSDTDVEPKDKQVYLQIIKTNNELLLKLINDVLDLSQIESGHMRFNMTNFNLNLALKDLFVNYQQQMTEGVELQLHMQDKMMIQTDQHRLIQIVTNLLANAIKFTIQGYIRIGYTVNEPEQTVSVFVEDTGIGIPASKQRVIFERFNKLNEFVQGTGLGLPICKVIAEHLGGELHLKSEQGKGSIFFITLPIKHKGKYL